MTYPPLLYSGKYEIDDSKFAKRYPLETTKTVEASSALASAPVADDALWVFLLFLSSSLITHEG